MSIETIEKIMDGWEKKFWKHMYESGIMDGNIDEKSFDFIPKEIKKLLLHGVRETEDETFKKVGSWYKLPLRKGMSSTTVKGLGKFRGGGCEVCGGKLVMVRGKYPGTDKRKTCPTCALEIIEQILDNCNNRQAATAKSLNESI